VSIVHIDEEDPHHHDATVGRPETTATEYNDDDYDDDAKPSTRKIQPVLFVGCAVVVIVLAIVLPMVIINQRRDENDGTAAATETTTLTPTSPSSSSFDYPCFTSTLDMVMAQIDDLVDSNFTATADRYVFCPGTHIQVGVFNNPASTCTWYFVPFVFKGKKVYLFAGRIYPSLF
jgi:hypothetical protein